MLYWSRIIVLPAAVLEFLQTTGDVMSANAGRRNF